MPDTPRDEKGRPLPPGYVPPQPELKLPQDFEFEPTPKPPIEVDLKAIAEELLGDAIEWHKNRDPRWKNVFGEEVDLDNIDREYALNILMMYHAKCVKLGYTRDDMIGDRLIQKLREVVLTGSQPGLRDKLRAEIYNLRNKRAGYPYRARGFRR